MLRRCLARGRHQVRRRADSGGRRLERDFADSRRCPMTHRIRNTIALCALASLPGLAFAAGSQAGDNGRQPIGADNEGPRMAIPGESTEAGQWQSYDSNGYYDPYRRPRVYVGDAPQTSYVPPPAVYYYPAPQYHYYAPPGY